MFIWRASAFIVLFKQLAAAFLWLSFNRKEQLRPEEERPPGVLLRQKTRQQTGTQESTDKRQHVRHERDPLCPIRYSLSGSGYVFKRLFPVLAFMYYAVSLFDVSRFRKQV